jgi:hypothetical protein
MRNREKAFNKIIEQMPEPEAIYIGEMLRIDSRFIDVGSGMILAAQSRVISFDLHAIAAGVGEMALEMTRVYYKSD